MKLWKIERTDEWSYDDYDSAVVAAIDEQAARMTTPDGRPFRSDLTAWAANADLVKVEYIGEAKPGTTAGVIIASFNAG